MTYDINRGPWWLVQRLDPDGLVRGWAAGDPADKDGVRSEAAHQLRKYRTKKDAVGDPLGQASYTLAEELIDVYGDYAGVKPEASPRHPAGRVSSKI